MPGPNLAVLVKQVPDPDGAVFVDEAAGCFSAREWAMGRAEAYAMEQALRIKEALPGAEITVLTVGPARAEAALRRALAMGGDHGVLVLAGEGPLPGLAVASAAAILLKDRAMDLILCGVQADDDEAGAVGPMLAALLGIPGLTSVVDCEVFESGGMRAVREVEGGVRESFTLGLPALAAIQTSEKTPRYPSLSNVLRARKQEIRTVSLEEIDLPEARENFLGLDRPPAPAPATFLQGSLEEQARTLRNIFREKGLL